MLGSFKDFFSRVYCKIRNDNPASFEYQALNRSTLNSLKIISDEIHIEPVNPDKEFSFYAYSNAIASIINSSYQKLSVGIYGEWGTGKTTLMRLIENELKPRVFTWERVPGSDNDRLKYFLKANFNLDWIDSEHVKITKSNEREIMT